MRRLLAAALAGVALLAVPAQAGPPSVKWVYELTGLDECMDCIPSYCNVAQCETQEELLHVVWTTIAWPPLP